MRFFNDLQRSERFRKYLWSDDLSPVHTESDAISNGLLFWKLFSIGSVFITFFDLFIAHSTNEDKIHQKVSAFKWNPACVLMASGFVVESFHPKSILFWKHLLAADSSKQKIAIKMFIVLVDVNLMQMNHVR